MKLASFVTSIEALIEGQGGERFAALALGELGLTYIEDVPPKHRAFFLERCVALWEEAQ